MAAGSINPSEAIFVLGGDQVFPQLLRPRRGIFRFDDFVFGPCEIDPLLHLRRRKDFWKAFNETMAVPSEVRRSWRKWEKFRERDFSVLRRFVRNPDQPFFRHPIVLWTVRSWRDRVGFWWILHVLRPHHAVRNRVWVAESDSGEFTADEADWYLATHPRKRLEEAFAKARPLSPAVLRAGASLWKKFASPVPREFDKARRHAVYAFPDLPVVAEPHGWVFPRLTGGRRPQLMLSRIDALILGSLRRSKWLRPVDLITGRSEIFELFFQWCSEMFVAHRLSLWATHRPDAHAIVARPVPTGVNFLTRVAYQLTNHGAELLKKGLRSLDDAPTMYIGGCKVYDAARPWVRVDQGKQWRLIRLHWTG